MPEGEDGQESESHPAAPKGQARKFLIQALFQARKTGNECYQVGARAWDAAAHTQ